MHQTLDRVFSASSPNRPTTERQTEEVREEAMQFALRLLDHYRADLAQRSPAPSAPSQS
jgi:hypothetical protein